MDLNIMLAVALEHGPEGRGTTRARASARKKLVSQSTVEPVLLRSVDGVIPVDGDICVMCPHIDVPDLPVVELVRLHAMCGSPGTCSQRFSNITSSSHRRLTRRLLRHEMTRPERR